MRVRRLRTGIALTELGFGGAQIGNLYEAMDDETAAETVDAAWDAGIRYFDTAPYYGRGLSERRLGAVLARRPRNAFVLSTKVGRLLVPAPERAHLRADDAFDVSAGVGILRDYSRDGVLRSIEESLGRLGLDRIDIAYVHDPDDFAEAAITEAIPALVELREQGVLGAVGIGMNQTEVPTRAVRRTDLDVVMIAGRFTALEQPALDDLLPAAVERGVSVVAAAVFNSGLLSRRRADASLTYNYEPAPPQLIERVNAMAEACEAAGTSLPAVALQFPLRHPAVVSVVAGMRTAEHVRGNIERYAATVPEQAWTQLAAEGFLPAA